MSFHRYSSIARKQKYGAKRIESEPGVSHASKLEAAVDGILRLREKAGEIEIVQRQCRVELTRARIVYIADWKCRDISSGEIFFVEAKGFETPEWRIKLRLWREYAEHKLELWKGSYRNPQLVETIVPRGGESD